jgi:hypothetical protein
VSIGAIVKAVPRPAAAYSVPISARRATGICIETVSNQRAGTCNYGRILGCDAIIKRLGKFITPKTETVGT